jgi:hypothetical protein
MDLSLVGLINQYKQTKEGFNDDKDVGTAIGISSGILVTIIMINLILWISAIVLLVKYWKILPDWAKILGILGVIPVVPLGPIITIIVVLLGRQK